MRGLPPPFSAVFKATVQNSTLRASSESSRRSVSSICSPPPPHPPSTPFQEEDGVPYLLNPSKAQLSEVDRGRKLYVNQNVYLVIAPPAPPLRYKDGRFNVDPLPLPIGTFLVLPNLTSLMGLHPF